MPDTLSLQPPIKTHISIVLVLRPLPEKIQDYYITILIAPDLIGNPVGDSKLEKKIKLLISNLLKVHMVHHVRLFYLLYVCVRQ